MAEDRNTVSNNFKWSRNKGLTVVGSCLYASTEGILTAGIFCTEAIRTQNDTFLFVAAICLFGMPISKDVTTNILLLVAGFWISDILGGGLSSGTDLWPVINYPEYHSNQWPSKYSEHFNNHLHCVANFATKH